MKTLLTLSLSILLSNIVLGQANSWEDSVLNKVILHEIVIYDQAFKPIKGHNIKLVSTDTVVNGQWTRPRFVDNIFQPSFDGVLVERSINFDTSTHKTDANYIDFTNPHYGNNGNYLKDSIVFLVEKQGSLNHILKQDVELLNSLKQTTWENSSIVWNNQAIELDSCHKIFRLQLNEDFTFNQFYGNGQNQCFTFDMQEKTTVGIEGNEALFDKYHNKLQGHYLRLEQGVWQVENNELRLVNVQQKKVLTFEIENLHDEALELKLSETNYRIKMKKYLR
jgi:hypothetical protein